MKHSVCLIAICFITLTGCTTTPYEKNNIRDRIGGDSNTLMLNYENRVKEYERLNIDSHLKIYIEIEKPYIINLLTLKDPGRIYTIAEIEGTTVFRIGINDKGTITNSEKILSAGLGLDELAADILQQIKIEPSYLAGKPDNSNADIKIIFKMDDLN